MPLLGLLASGLQAHAHPGHGSPNGFTEGLTHPLSGLDHLMAMIAVGLWAAQLGGRATWLVPSAFVAVMMGGGMLGWSGVPLPFVEAGILSSVVVFGLLVATSARLPLTACMGLVGAFALFHGHAHGAEIPGASSRLAYGLGFIIATGLLHVGGILLGDLVRRMATEAGVRYAGGAVTAMGVWLWLA